MPSFNLPPQLSEEAIFQAAAALPPNERVSYLLAACDGRPEVRAAVEQLLASVEDEAFMKRAADRSVSPELDAELLRLKPEEVGERIGNYKLLEQIGEGGFGVVWVAEQEQPVRRRVALKIIKLGMNTKEVIARFEQERQALAMMDHPNIAKVLEAGATPFGRPFFVMELVRGIKITEYCDQANLPTAERLRLFIAVCQAVQHAHQKGIIHRDLKPSNILVTLHDGVPVPKVIDFGVAKATQQQRLTDLTVYTQFEQMIGTPLYMSPEQAEMTGLDIDTRSDIYSLGVLLYELLVGRTPFDPKELMKAGYDEMRRVIREQEPQKPSTFLSTMALDIRTSSARRRQTDSAKWIGQIRGDLDWIVMKALEKDRTRRYDTATGLANDIQRHLSSEPVQARPPTQLYRFRRFAKRNKIAFTAASAVLAALLIGLSVSTWMFFKERHARKRAVTAEQEQGRSRQLSVAAERAQRDERIKAETEASKSAQVAEFLKDMLGSVGPSVALGRDTKMLREILDKTAERVGKDLRKQPDVEADLRSTLGEVYREIGEYMQAGAMHAEALAIRKKLFGDEHPAVAKSLCDLATALMHQGKLAEAETMHREALAMRRKLLGNEHPYVALSLTNLSAVLSEREPRVQVEPILREALAIYQKRFGKEHETVARSLNNLAIALSDQGKLAEAETMHREALAMNRKVFANEHPAVARSLDSLGTVLRMQGRSADAEILVREALTMMRKLCGDDHPEVAMSLNNVAAVLTDQGKFAEAEPMNREALGILRKVFGNEHRDVAIALHNVASTVYSQGKLAEAETSFRELLVIQRKLFGSAHAEVLLSLNNLAAVLGKQRRLADAEIIVREALAVRKQLSGIEHPDVATAVIELATLLRKQGKQGEVDQLFRSELAAIRNSPTKDLSSFDRMLMQFGHTLSDETRYAEAEVIYREALANRQARRSAEHEEVLSSMAALGRLLVDWAWSDHRAGADAGSLEVGDSSALNASKGRTPCTRAHEAERLLQDCLAVRLRGAKAAHWLTADVRSRLGAAMVAVVATDHALTGQARQAKLTEAESLLREGNEALQRAENAFRVFQRASLARLVRLYEAWEKPDKVAVWQQKLADFESVEAKTETEEKPVSPEP